MEIFTTVIADYSTPRGRSGNIFNRRGRCTLSRPSNIAAAVFVVVDVTDKLLAAVKYK